MSDQYVKMDGDPVYEHLKTKVKDGMELVGAKFVKVEKFTHQAPWKIIELKVMEPVFYKFNYNKIERGLK